MKKIVSFLAAACLMFTCTATAFATNGNYLPAEVTDTEKTFYAVDFEQEAYTEGTIKADTFKANENNNSYIGLALNSGTGEIVSDPIKGGKSILFTGSTAWQGITVAQTDTVSSGDKYFLEFSIKTSQYSDVRFQIMNNFRVFTMSKGANGNTKMGVTDETQVLFDQYELNKWYHVVLQIEPQETTGLITPYVNGVKYATKPNSNYKLSNFNGTWAGSRIQCSTTEGQKIWLDDFKCWKSSQNYDPVAAGDAAKITSDKYNVTNNTINYYNAETLADLRQALEAGTGEIIFFEDDKVITDEAAPVGNNVKAVVRSQSGAEVESYTLSEAELYSESYSVSDGKISGVPYYTTHEQFEAKLGCADGTAPKMEYSDRNVVTSGDTVTVGGNTYTVELELFYESDMSQADTKLVSGGQANASVTYGAEIDGKKALEVAAAKDGAIRHNDFNNANTFGNKVFNRGDIVNFEYSFYGDENAQFTITVAGHRVLAIDGDVIRAMNETFILDGASWKHNEWNKVVISVCRDGVTDNNEDGTSKTYTSWRIFLNEEQLNWSKRSDGYFANSGFFWNNSDAKSNKWRITVGVKSAGAKAYISDVKLYSSALQDYDTTLESAANYIDTEDGLIYVDKGENLEDALNELTSEGAVIVSVEDYAEADMNTLVRVTDPTGTKTQVYSFALTNEIVVVGDVVKAYSKDSAVSLYAAEYSDDGELLNVILKTGDGNAVIKLNVGALTAENNSVKAFLWDGEMKPKAAVIGF